MKNFDPRAKKNAPAASKGDRTSKAGLKTASAPESAPKTPRTEAKPGTRRADRSAEKPNRAPGTSGKGSAARKSAYSIETFPMTGGEITSVKPYKPKKKRVWELDFLRGLAILLVAMDHTFYDCWAIFADIWAANPALAGLSEFARDYWTGDLRAFWKPFFLFVFFFVSGISSGFSKNNLFRSFKLIAAALFINLATYILEFSLGMPDVFIRFGVIQCFAVIVLLYAVIELLVNALTFKAKRLRKYVVSIVCVAVGIAALVADSKYNVGVMDYEQHGICSDVAWDSPLAALFFYVDNSWTLPSADYFPLLPFLGYFMLGAGLTNVLYPKKKSLLPFLDGYRRLPRSGRRVYVGWWHKLFTVPGKYSLIIYILWQVVALFILGAVTLAVFGELPFF